MKKDKKILTIIISVVLIMTPVNVLAHPGGLDSNKCHYCRTNCAKWGLDNDEYHCHSGDIYTNKNGDIYDKSGTKISVNNTTTTATTSTTQTPTTKRVYTTTNKITTKTEQTTQKKETLTTQIKNKDTSLKYVKIDNKDISILDNMTYETNKKNIELNIEANDEKALIEFDKQELKIGANEIIIKVTAEAGNVKEYKLVVTRTEAPSDVVIEKFIFGASEVIFENNKATIQKLTNQSSFEFSYELSDKNAKLLLFINDKEVTKFDNIKDKDTIKLVIVDSEENKNIYEIEVQEMSKSESAIINTIAYTIVGIIFLSPAIIIGTIIYLKKQKK